MQPVKIGLIGLGTVGTGTVNVLIRNYAEISRRAGRSIVPVIAAVRDTGKKRGLLSDNLTIVTDPMEVVNNPEVDIVVELMGGEGMAFDLVSAAIKNKKHVVTANKALIACKGNELFKLAGENGVMIAFEAAVAGGIPVIKAIREGLTANVINSVVGIVNGTSNYILTGMLSQKAEFNTMLEEAQAKGYAEADPAFDIEGVDSAHKLTILASTAFGIPLQFKKVYIEGITDIAYDDIENADELGYVIKSLAIAKLHSDNDIKTVEMRVHPTLIPKDSLMGNVHGVMNAIMINGDAVGDSMLFGPGAGSEPTASSVVADIVDVVRTLSAPSNQRVPHLAFQDDQLSDAKVINIEQSESAYYLNLTVKNEPGVLGYIANVFGDASISIKAIQQKENETTKDNATIILLTEKTVEQSMLNALEELNNSSVLCHLKRIRVGI